MRYHIYSNNQDPKYHGNRFFVIDDEAEEGIDPVVMQTSLYALAIKRCTVLNENDRIEKKELMERCGYLFTRKEVTGLVTVGLVLLALTVWCLYTIFKLIF